MLGNGEVIVMVMAITLVLLLLLSRSLTAERVVFYAVVASMAAVVVVVVQHSNLSRDMKIAFVGSSSGHSYAREEPRTSTHRDHQKKLAASKSQWGDM